MTARKRTRVCRCDNVKFKPSARWHFALFASFEMDTRKYRCVHVDLVARKRTAHYWLLRVSLKIWYVYAPSISAFKWLNKRIMSRLCSEILSRKRVCGCNILFCFPQTMHLWFCTAHGEHSSLLITEWRNISLKQCYERDAANVWLKFPSSGKTANLITIITIQIIAHWVRKGAREPEQSESYTCVLLRNLNTVRSQPS